MKKKSRKVISLFITVVVTISMSVTAFAASNDSVGGVNEIQSIDNPASGTATSNTDVSVTKGGSFSVTIPKKITLPGSPDSNGDHKQSYSITVKGDIGSDQQISVVPDATVSLNQINKGMVTGTVTQGAQIFQLATGDNENLDSTSHIQLVSLSHLTSTNGFTAMDTGMVSASGLSAGTWTGSYNYNISLGEIPEPITYKEVTFSFKYVAPESHITQMRTYTPDGVLQHTYNTIAVGDSYVAYAGGKIVFTHSSNYYWQTDLHMERWQGTYFHCTVPSDADGDAVMAAVGGDYSGENAKYDLINVGYGSGWLQNLDTFVLGE